MAHDIHELAFTYRPLETLDYARRIGLAVAALSTGHDPELARAAALHALLSATHEDGSTLSAALN